MLIVLREMFFIIYVVRFEEFKCWVIKIYVKICKEMIIIVVGGVMDNVYVMIR